MSVRQTIIINVLSWLLNVQMGMGQIECWECINSEIASLVMSWVYKIESFFFIVLKCGLEFWKCLSCVLLSCVLWNMHNPSINNSSVFASGDTSNNRFVTQLFVCSVRSPKFHPYSAYSSTTLPPHLSESHPIAASYCTTYNLQRDTRIACGPSEKDNNSDGVVEHGTAHLPHWEC